MKIVVCLKQVPDTTVVKIDPKTGFANLFYTSGLTNIKKNSSRDSARTA